MHLLVVSGKDFYCIETFTALFLIDSSFTAKLFPLRMRRRAEEESLSRDQVRHLDPFSPPRSPPAGWRRSSAWACRPGLGPEITVRLINILE